MELEATRLIPSAGSLVTPHKGGIRYEKDAATCLVIAVQQIPMRTKTALSFWEGQIELLKQVEGRNIARYRAVRVNDSGESMSIYIDIKCREATPVSSLLRQYGPFDESLARALIRLVLDGLKDLHGQGVVHRNIRGENILVTSEGGVRIIGFDEAMKVGGDVDARRLPGSVYWIAPEISKQTRFDSCTSDLWSLGCLVVEMLTGERPWAGFTQMQVLFKLGARGTPPIPEGISPELVDFLNLTFEQDYQARSSASVLLTHAWSVIGL